VAKRVTHEPAFVLHRYDWSESSLILEIFTRHHGRIALAAKGVKRPSSNFRPVLLPLQPLQIAFGGEGEIRALKGAEWMGRQVMPIGEALLSGYYLNELLLRLLARDDPHEALFDAYAGAVGVLATPGPEPAQGVARSCALRSFELLLLRETGLLPALDVQTATLAPLHEDERYALLAEQGLREAAPGESALDGAAWCALQGALGDVAPLTLNRPRPTPWSALMGIVATLPPGANAALRTQLRAVLLYHCGAATLRTRQMMKELQSL
jgi:DNA repair protein RecO (recombination protein O)